MRLTHILAGLLAVLMLFMSGCAKFGTSTRPTWIDPAEISKGIDKSKKQTTVLDAAELEAEKESSEPRIRDLSETTSSKNPYLQNISKPKPKVFPKLSEDEGILLNFDNADIYEVIQVIAETLGLKYIIDPQVKGVVNIRSGDKIPMNQLYDIFKKILNINGLDIRSEGEYEYIYVAKRLTSQIIYDSNQAGKLKETPRVVTQVVPILHLSSAEIIKLIEPYLSNKGIIYNLADHNTIIITDFETNIIDALMLLARLDVSPLSSLKVRLVRIKNAPLFDLRDELVEILSALKINKKDFEGISVLVLERVNSLLLMGNNDLLLDNADKWIRELDVVPSQGRDNIYIYNVRNSVASDLESLVSSLISEKGAGGSSKPVISTPAAKDSKSTGGAKPQKTTRSSSTASTPTLHFIGEPILFADDSRNVILIRAMPADYSRILKLLERLDNIPRQVLIEVLVAEVKLSDELRFGIEWALEDNEHITKQNYRGNIQTDFNTEENIGAGITLSIFNSADDIRAFLKALASDNHVNVLSSPHVMVLNNETATVNVGQEVPIVTTESISDSTTTSNVRTVQYRDTGIILTVTPRINYDGIIILEVEQQVSDISEETVEGIQSPIIRNREIKTKVAVKDGQPILMGGLIQTDEESSQSGVPGFKDIPVLGWLFKYESKKTTKTELLVLITPYVIESEDVLDQYIAEFQKRMVELRKEITEVSEMKHSRFLNDAKQK